MIIKCVSERGFFSADTGSVAKGDVIEVPDVFGEAVLRERHPFIAATNLDLGRPAEAIFEPTSEKPNRPLRPVMTKPGRTESVRLAIEGMKDALSGILGQLLGNPAKAAR